MSCGNLELDKSGNGYAVLRFLLCRRRRYVMAKSLESCVSRVLIGQWYIENSLTTLNQKDTVSEENTRLWNTGIEADKEIELEKEKENYLTILTSMLSAILNILKTKAKYSYLNMVRKFLTSYQKR